jgi:hypothetical protein
VGETLARFCQRSRCYPGGCLIEELVGETYPIFRQVLDDYDVSQGVDFLGYASRRLYWGLQHCARRLERAVFRAPPPEAREEPPPRHTIEERVLDRLLARELLARLDTKDAALLVSNAAGHTCTELAESAGVSPATLRKRLERLRGRLRSVTEPGQVRSGLPAPNGSQPRGSAQRNGLRPRAEANRRPFTQA